MVRERIIADGEIGNSTENEKTIDEGNFSPFSSLLCPRQIDEEDEEKTTNHENCSSPLHHHPRWFLNHRQTSRMI